MTATIGHTDEACFVASGRLGYHLFMNFRSNQVTVDSCPFCGHVVRGDIDFLVGWFRFDHILDHALRAALQIPSEFLGDVQFEFVRSEPEPASWSDAIELARASVDGALGAHIRSMYQVGSALADAGALGPLTWCEAAMQFRWKQPVERLREELEKLAAQLK